MKTIILFFDNQFIKIILVALAYFLASKIGRGFVIPPGNVTPLWPPSGIALAALFCFRKEGFPGLFSGIFIGAFFSNLSFSENPLHVAIFTNSWIGMGAVLQAQVGAYFLKRMSLSQYPFGNAHNVLVFVFIGGFFSALVNSTLGTTGLMVMHLIEPDHFGITWLTWWLGDSVGIISVASVIIAWSEKEERDYNTRGIIEGLFLLIALSITYIIMHDTHFQLLYIMLLIYIFLVYRSGTQIALLFSMVSTGYIIYENANGYTVFDANSSNASMLLLQLFVCCVFITTQILAALITERKVALNSLQVVNRELENRVFERTKDLNEKNSLLKEEMEKSEALGKKLVTLARNAGMAEVANSILHNAGNVLNGVNVSVSLLIEKINKNRLSDLSKASDFLQANLKNLGSFFTEDSKGRHFPNYLSELAKYWQEEKKDLLTELGTLSGRVDHIKQIVAMQEPLSGNTVVEEKASLKNICEEAINLSGVDSDLHNISFIRNYVDLPDIQIDKLKVLQILINLLTNAKDATKEGRNPEKKIVLRLFADHQKNISLEVKDNGVGIANENMDKIFASGFTTKESGHGIGLHSSAILAQEIGGSLHVKSDGPNQGASFILTLKNKPFETGI